ncbi:hypothetical protein, partial [Oleiagrimonas sp. MCCC 1A03011]|uniref:hypothetical protein n=1 Tax=Oleiagrimonas sp. MCCC 1A03011 TaxID=1926883 RepID=UPI001981C60A
CPERTLLSGSSKPCGDAGGVHWIIQADRPLATPAVGVLTPALALMTTDPKDSSPVAIKIEGGRNIRLDNNVSVGMPLLDAKDVENLSGSENKSYIQSQQEQRWHEHTLVKALVTLLVTVAAAGIIYALGWK